MTKHSFILALIALLLGACSAATRPGAAFPGQPVDTEIRAVTVVGALSPAPGRASARTAQGAWQPLAEGQHVRGVTELRATGRRTSRGLLLASRSASVRTAPAFGRRSPPFA
jgi:hypothetical protein